MTYPSAKAVRWTEERFVSLAPAGAFRFYTREETGAKIVGINFKCPCGCGSVYGGRFEGGDGPKWTWDGNESAPTVTPSFGCYPTGNKADTVGPDGYHWHGFLTAGEFCGC